MLLTWVAFMVALFIGGEIIDVASFAIAGVAGLAIVWLGFWFATARALKPRSRPDAVRLGALAIGAGAALGIANLAANALIAATHPSIRAVMVERMSTLSPLVGLIATPIVEEIGIRLFLLSALVWVLRRVTARPSLAFGIALVVSSAVFALPHLDRPMPQESSVAAWYQAALIAKYTLLSMPLGWIFWRWGLPYAMLGHSAANALHLLARPIAF